MNPWNLILAFVEGFALILSPCILPILPIVLSAGVAGGRQRPYGIIAGFVVSFWVFTLFSRQLVLLFGIDQDLIRKISFVALLVFGVVLLSTTLSEKFSALTQKLANWGQRLSKNTGAPNNTNDFYSGFVLGCCIGLIWSPCAGPIIAVILVQLIRSATNLQAALMLAAFSLGAGLPMLLITLGGKTVMSRLNFFKTHSVLVRRALGVVIIATVLITGGATLLEAPAQGPRIQKNIPVLSKPAAPKLTHGITPYPAKDFIGISSWINSKPLTMASLKGKVVLVDFWTYSCINCVRTLPYITSWDKKYRAQGLVIVGVHSPEFEFEKNPANVKMAVKQHGILYPVAMDNNLDTFVNFNNQYWPAHYLIDRSGKVVYTHFGEGEYDVTENNIRALLGVAGTAAKGKEESSGFGRQTPETYLGYTRARNFQSPERPAADKAAAYTFPKNLSGDCWALNGKWKIGGEFITATEKNAALRFHFTARKVFLVLGPANGKPVNVTVLLNGKPVKTIAVKQHTLYELLDQGARKDGLLEIKTDAPGLSAYAFTFG